MSLREERLDDLGEAFRVALDQFASQLWTAMPATVVSVDLDAQTVAVQPTIRGQIRNHETGEWKSVDMPVCPDVPIVFMRAGPFALTFPVAEGDECLLIFASRCIDGWWESGEVSEQAELRKHDLADGFAFFGPTSQPRKLSAVSAANVQLRHENGNTVIEITPDGKVNVVASTEINMTAPTLNVTADVNITGAVTIDGELTQSGGEATLTDLPVVISTHVHGLVQTGDDESGGPVP